MILIIGGAYQGKTTFAKESYKLSSEDIVNGKDLLLGSLDIKSYKCIDDFEKFVLACLEAKRDALEEAKSLISRNNSLIIICKELGCGVVPIDREERRYREAVGRVSSYLARESESVIRIFCSLPQRLK